MIIIKSPREIDLIREAGRVVALVFQEVEPLLVPGTTTADIDAAVESIIRREGAIPAEKGYYGYPASVCTSVNEVILHGIPSKKTVLKDGDVSHQEDVFLGEVA